MIGRVLAAVTAAATLAGALSARAEPVRTGHLEAELAPMSATATPGSTVWVALRQKLDDGWHTYWRNEGDAGGPTEIAWTLPGGWRAGDILWPTPERVRTQSLMSYAYTGEVLLPMPLQAPGDARPGETARLKARADFFVCSDTLCVPESADLSLDVKIAEGPAAPHPTYGRAVAETLAAAPKPAGIKAAAQLQGGALKLAAWGGPLTGADAAGAYFFPYERGLIAHAAVQSVERGAEGLTLTLKPDARFAAITGPISGVLATRAGAWEITAVPGAVPAAAAGGGAAPGAEEAGAETPAAAGGLGGATAVLFALLGGLLLNFMPCVFPVLSMKAAHLAERAHAPGAARRDALAFLAGVLVAFLALAGALVAAKAAGQAVGWGFQLQSPWATAFLSLLMLAVALNLSGLFELGTSVQGTGAGLQRREGAAGAFFTGALAVVVAAPCSAPFMATAMGAALAQGPVLTLAVFAALGVGLALPFVALSLSPALLRRLPKPGPWMDGLRRLLAFPMYAAAAWMAWVFARQSGDFGLAFLFGAALALALALHLYGRAQRAQGRRAILPLGGAGVAFAAAVFLGVWGAAAEPGDKPAAAATATPSEPFSPARLTELRAEGRPVLVNFTADWCVTCKVNERALEAEAVQAAFGRTGVVYMVADWTRRDDVIAAALAEQGRSGVPLYLLYRPGEPEPVVLPQLLTEGALVDALEGAA